MNQDETKVLICKHLRQGAALKEVYHLEDADFSWRFLCDCAEHSQEDLCEATYGEISALYPDILPLAAMPVNCMCRKGKNSDKWYDFHF